MAPLRAIGLCVLLLLLGFTAYNGIIEGVAATHYSTTRGMKAATVGQLLYGFTAAATLLALVFQRRLVAPLLVIWGIGGTLVAALAPVVYGGQPWGIGVLSGAAAGFLFWLIHSLWRRAQRVTRDA
jgi:uncharacterized membrane protein YwaF